MWQLPGNNNKSLVKPVITVCERGRTLLFVFSCGGSKREKLCSRKCSIWPQFLQIPLEIQQDRTGRSPGEICKRKWYERWWTATPCWSRTNGTAKPSTSASRGPASHVLLVYTIFINGRPVIFCLVRFSKKLMLLHYQAPSTAKYVIVGSLSVFV